MKKFKFMLVSLLIGLANAGPLGGENGTALEEDTFERADFDTTQTYVAKASALGAYGEVAIDKPVILMMSPHLDSYCTSISAERSGDLDLVGFSMQTGFCNSYRFPGVGGDTTSPGTILNDASSSMMFLGSVDPFNKSALDIADGLNANEEAPIDCSVIKNEAGETETIQITDGVTGIGPDNPYVNALDVAASYTTVEQGFDCRIAKDASGDVKVRMRGLTALRFSVRNLPPVDISIRNGDLVYDDGTIGTVAKGVHSVADIRMVDTTYDASADGDGVSSGKLLSSITVGSVLGSTIQDVKDSLMLIDFEFDIEDLKAGATNTLTGGSPALSLEYAVGEVELAYSFQRI